MIDAGQLLDALPLPAAVIDPAGRIALLNGPARRLMGARALGAPHVPVLRQPRLLAAIDAGLGGAEDSAPFVSREAGTETSWTVRVRPLPDRGVLLVFEDRTASDEIGQVRREFVANVSHELKTPITALLGYVETLRGPARNDPAARDRFLESMAREAQRMSRLVSDLLALSRVEADGRVRPRTAADLADTVRGVEALIRERDRAGAARLTVRLPARAPLSGDPAQLEQVVSNLVENALRYAPGAAVEVRLDGPEDVPALGGSAWRLSVRDEGPGIAAHHLPRITERFYRADDHRSREVGGTGLGLAIVKHVVARHRGRLRIESEPGEGTRVTVLLPAMLPQGTESPPPS